MQGDYCVPQAEPKPTKWLYLNLISRIKRSFYGTIEA